MARKRIIPIRLNDEEYEVIKAKAKKIGLNPSAFIRMNAIKN